MTQVTESNTEIFNMEANAKLVKKAARIVAQLTTSQKNNLLSDMAKAIEHDSANIIVENTKDISSGREKGLTTAMLDRLLLTEQGIVDIADAIREIVTLADPVGDIANLSLRPNGMQVGKMRIP